MAQHTCSPASIGQPDGWKQCSASRQHGGYHVCRCTQCNYPSALWCVLYQSWGVNHITSSTYHPSPMAWLSMRTGKLRMPVCLAGAEWPLLLPWVLLGLRAAPNEDSVVSSAELVYGTALTLWPVPPQQNSLPLTTSSSSSPQPLPLLSRPHMLRLWPQFQTNC
jgi:hypothetical protein